MSITLNETFRVSAPPERVWQFLKNPAAVVTCLPGAELTETIDAQTYGGRVKVKVGPITAAYAGRASLTQVDDQTRRMQIVAEGKESGGAGSARMTMTGVVTALADGQSEVSVDAVIDIAGRVMQFGRGLIESVNKQLFRQFADAVRATLEQAESAERPSGDDDSTHGAAGAPPDGGVPDGGAPPPRQGARDAIASPRVTPSPITPLAQGKELRPLLLLWKVFAAWVSGVVGRRR